MGKRLDKFKAAVRPVIEKQSKRPVLVIPKGTLTEKKEGNTDSRASRQIVIFADSAEDKKDIQAAAKKADVSMSRFILDILHKTVEKSLQG
jgi:hypothetical protein